MICSKYKSNNVSRETLYKKILFAAKYGEYGFLQK